MRSTSCVKIVVYDKIVFLLGKWTIFDRTRPVEWVHLVGGQLICRGAPYFFQVI